MSWADISSEQVLKSKHNGYQTETYQIPQTGVLKFVVSDPDKNKQLLVRIN